MHASHFLGEEEGKEEMGEGRKQRMCECMCLSMGGSAQPGGCGSVSVAGERAEVCGQGTFSFGLCTYGLESFNKGTYSWLTCVVFKKGRGQDFKQKCPDLEKNITSDLFV